MKVRAKTNDKNHNDRSCRNTDRKHGAFQVFRHLSLPRRFEKDKRRMAEQQLADSLAQSALEEAAEPAEEQPAGNDNEGFFD